MTSTILSYLLPFLAGIGLMYFIQKPADLPEPETVAISMGTYENMFARPETFRDPFLKRVYIVSERVETRVDTIRVPYSHVDRRGELRLSYGDITIEHDRVRMGVFNPQTRQWEASEYRVPVRTWTTGLELFAGYPIQADLSYTVWHRSGLFARARGGFVSFPNDAVYLGAGIGFRF